MSYEAERKVLWNAAARLDDERQREEANVELWERTLKASRKKVEQLREDSLSIKSAANTLGLMDKARVTMKPDAGEPS